MSDKPTTAAGYHPQFLEVVRSTCLYMATKLGDLLDDIVVIGGMVPSLLIPPGSMPGIDSHVGTRDLDLGLQVAILNQDRYHDLTERLRLSGFGPDEVGGRRINQRWKLEAGKHQVTVDFLIAPTFEKNEGGRLLNIEEGFAAIITPGLELAFRDRVQVELSGNTVRGEKATRQVWVCGPGALIVLKSLAFQNRGENKDAYDLHYVLRNYGAGAVEVAERLRPLLDHASAIQALQILRDNFSEQEFVGTRRVAEFLGNSDDELILADVVGDVRALLTALGQPPLR